MENKSFVTLQKMLIRQVVASTLTEWIKQVAAGKYDIILLDVDLPDGNGLEYLPKFKEVSPSSEVIIITGKGEQDGAKKAILSGAWAYIEKPNVTRDLLLHLTRALQYQEEKNRVKKNSGCPEKG